MWLTGLKFKNRAQRPFINWGFSHKLSVMEKLALSCLLPTLNCLPALCSCHWANLYTAVSGNVFQLTRLRLAPSNQSHAAISPSTSSLTAQSGSILTNQDNAFQMNRTARIKISRFHEDRPIKEEWQNFSLYKLPFPWLGKHTFSFHWRLKVAHPHWGWNMEDIFRTSMEQGRAVQTRASPDQRGPDQNKVEQSCLDREGPLLRAISQVAMLFHSHADRNCAVCTK